MQEKIFLSFITSIYNVNKYLNDFLESFLSLKKIRFELIIVDDKGTENPAMILDKYRKLIPMKVITNKKNFGLAISRNIALENISKESTHVMYVDSDDRLHDNKFVNDIKLDKITFFNYHTWKNNGLVFKNINKNFGKNTFIGVIWGKALPVTTAKTFKFDENIRYYEDILINRRIINNNNDIILSYNSAIDYRQRKTSITNSFFTYEKFSDYVDQFTKCKKEKLLGQFFVEYGIRQKYWIFKKNFNKRKVNLGEARTIAKVLAFLGGNVIRFLGLKNIVYGKHSKNLFN